MSGIVSCLVKASIFISWLDIVIICLSAPGGTLSDEVTSTEVCLFKAQEDMETMQAYAQVNASEFLPRDRRLLCNFQNIKTSAVPFF